MTEADLATELENEIAINVPNATAQNGVLQWLHKGAWCNVDISFTPTSNRPEEKK